jgi:hypothetical protein
VQQEETLTSESVATKDSAADIDAANEPKVDEKDAETRPVESVVTAEETDKPANPEEPSTATEQPAQEVTPAAKEEDENSSPKESALTAEVIAGGAAVVAAGAVAAGAAVIADKEQEPKAVTTKEATSQPETDKDTLTVPSQPQPSANGTVVGTLKEPPTPEPEADPALAALAGDGEALLRKLELPSTDQLLASADNAPVHAKGAKQGNETTTATEAGPSTTAQPASTTEGPADNAAANKGDENSRSPSQNRSVTAVSLNHKNDSWLRNILRAVFVDFLGSIFSPFRRRGRTDQ